MNIKGIVIVIILILGIFFFNNLRTFREGAEEMTAEKAEALATDITSTISQKMSAAGATYTAPDTKDLFKQLKALMTQEAAYQRAQINATAEAEKTTPLAGITVAPTLINNSFFPGSKFSDPFCGLYSGTAKLSQQCNALTEDSCNLTDCCVYVNGTKCMAGDAKGPTNIAGVPTDSDYYLYKYQCYGNCNKPVKSASQIMDCSDDSTIISTNCFNEYGAKLNCSSLKFPNNVIGRSDTGIIIKDNKFDMTKEAEGMNWGRMKRSLADALKKNPQVCNDTMFMTNVFNLQSPSQPKTGSQPASQAASQPASQPASQAASQAAAQSTPQNIDCSDGLTSVSTTCFNEHSVKLNCSNISIPNNATGESKTGMKIANNQLNMSSINGLNWGVLKRDIESGIKNSPEICANTNFIKGLFKLKN